MATKYAQSNGNWSAGGAGGIWYDSASGGSVVAKPVNGDAAVINAGVTVTLDESTANALASISGPGLLTCGVSASIYSLIVNCRVNCTGGVIVFRPPCAFGSSAVITKSNAATVQLYTATCNSGSQFLGDGTSYYGGYGTAMTIRAGCTFTANLFYSQVPVTIEAGAVVTLCGQRVYPTQGGRQPSLSSIGL